MKKRKKNLVNKYYIITVIIILIVLVLLLSQRTNNKKYPVDNLLKDKTQEIVYGIEYSKVKKIPVINIDNPSIKKIQEDINKKYEKNSHEIDYQYSLSEDTLSILIKETNKINGGKYILYQSYNIDLNRMELLTPEELLTKFNINIEDLKFFIENKLLNYYADLLDKKLIDPKLCDFTCFIENCNIQDYLDNNTYYIENNHLYLYKFFNIYTEYNYEKYFDENKFKFQIK